MRKNVLKYVVMIMCIALVGCGTKNSVELKGTEGNTGVGNLTGTMESGSPTDTYNAGDSDNAESSHNTDIAETKDNLDNIENSGNTTAKNPKYMTTMNVVKDMGIGINLGNTFESCGDWINGNNVTAYETAWGSPVITKAMIEGYAREGFRSLRIPVAWSNMMGANYTINPQLMSRVKEVTSWALEYDMYVIVNIHWDGGWWQNFPNDKENCMNKYKAMWTQIAKAFGDFDHRVIFESLNEEGCWDNVWNRYSGGIQGKAEAYGLLNEINQTFVDLVRNSGYNNGDRHLLIAGYATDIALTCDEAFVMPRDIAGRCAVSVHYYTPSNYCILTENASWGSVKTTWGTAEDKTELESNMNLLKLRFVDKGVPVIIGEFGCVMDNKDKANATLFLTSVAKEAYARDMCPMLWDITSNYSLYNRNNCAMSEYTELRDNFKGIVGD